MRTNLLGVVVLGSLLPTVTASSESPAASAPSLASDDLSRPHQFVRPRLRLVWVDPTSAASFAYAGMGREVRSILGAAGVDVIWDKGTSGPLAAGEMAVIVLNAEPARVAMRPHVMGCVIKGDGRPVLWLNLTTVARALGLDASSQWSGRERQQVATALGRVVAHEVVHAVAPQLPHATRGLLSATLDRSDLVHRRLRLDSDSADGFLRRTKLRDALPADGPALFLSRSRTLVSSPFSP